jgi:hypothetical protein
MLSLQWDFFLSMIIQCDSQPASVLLALFLSSNLKQSENFQEQLERKENMIENTLIILLFNDNYHLLTN